MYKNQQDQRNCWNRWYARNREQQRAAVLQRRTERGQWLADMKARLKCAHCPESNPVCLQFHHRNSADKEISVSKAVNSCWSIARLLKEIEKCDVLCANCHFKEHARLNALIGE